MTRHPLTLPGTLVVLFFVVVLVWALTHQPPAFVAPGVPRVVTQQADGR